MMITIDVQTYLPFLGIFARVFTIIIVGGVGIFWFAGYVSKFLKERITLHANQLVCKIFTYIGLLILLLVVLQELGFRLSVIIGAAGIAGVALSFASQTSISNIISGIFLLFEQSFIVGDRIECGSLKGTVESIDLLSIKLRTSNNTLVRIPNENVLKQHITNTTYFPTRRCVFQICVTQEQDVQHVIQIIENLIKMNKQSLSKPGPYVSMTQSGYITVTIQAKVWAKKKDYSALQRTLLTELRDGLRAKKIATPIIRYL